MDRAKIYDVLLDKLFANSLEEIVAAAAELLNQHIVVLDTSYKVLASWPHELIGDLYWDAQQKFGYVPEENIRMIFENKYPNATFEGISYVDWGNVNVPRCVATLQYRGKAMGHVSIYHTGQNLSVEEVREACACVEQVLKVVLYKQQSHSDQQQHGHERYNFQAFSWAESECKFDRGMGKGVRFRTSREIPDRSYFRAEHAQVYF